MTTTTGQRCPTCDRDPCPAHDLAAIYRAERARVLLIDEDSAEYERAVRALGDTYQRLGELDRDCAANRVDWRSRALAAEARVGTEGAVEPAQEEVEALARKLWEQTERDLYDGKPVPAEHLDYYWRRLGRRSQQSWIAVARLAWNLGARGAK